MTISATSFRRCNRFSPLLIWLLQIAFYTAGRQWWWDADLCYAGKPFIDRFEICEQETIQHQKATGLAGSGHSEYSGMSTKNRDVSKNEEQFTFTIEPAFFEFNIFGGHTVHGSELRRSPVEVGSWYPMNYTGFLAPSPGGFLAGFLNHQQYP